MKKRLVATLAALLGIVLVLSACTQKGNPTTATPQSTNNTIRVGYGTSLCHAPLHIAIENGYFKEEGLNVEAVKVETPLIAEAVSTNQVDASFGLVGKFAQPLENGLPIKFTSGIHTGCIKIVVPQDSSIKTVADLKGKKIGVAGLADSPAFIAKRALTQAGIGVTADKLEVEFIVYSNTDLPIALKNGAIDAFAGTDPVVSKAAAENNLKVILDTAHDEQYKDEYCCLSFVSTKFYQENPELTKKYTRAIMKASAWIEKNPKEAAQIQVDKQYVSGDVNFNAELLGSYNFKPSVSGGYTALQNTINDLQSIGIIKAETNAKALIENSFGRLEGLEDSVQ